MTSRRRSTRSGMPSGREGSPTPSRSSSRSPTSSSSAVWTTCRPWRRKRPLGSRSPLERPIFPRGQRRARPAVPGPAVDAGSGTSRRTRCSRSRATTSSRSCARSAAKGSTYAQHMKDATFHHPYARSSSRRSSTSSPRSRWRTATPRAMSTSTCSARSRAPGRTVSSARRVTSSGSWWR